MRLVLLLALFAVGFFGTAAVIRSQLPEPLSNGRRLKYEHLEAHGDEYSMVFIGSSRVNHTLIPSVVEERLAAAGHEHRIYNYGIAGMRSFEADLVLENLLELNLPKLEIVVMEWPDWDGVIFSDPTITERTVNWHDAGRTTAAVKSLWIGDYTDEVRRTESVRHLKTFGAHLTNYGLGSTWLQRQMGFETFEDLPSEVLRDGFAATGAVNDGTPEDMARRKEKTRAMLAKKHVLDLGNGIEVDPAHYQREALQAQAELARSHGIRLIWAVMPGERHQPQAWRLAADEPELPLLLFNSPKRFPEAYVIEHRWDPDHLNEEGARVFSASFGDVLAKELERP